jgi:hypothetical protein
MNRSSHLVLPLIKFSTLSASASSALDTAVHRSQGDFFFCSVPRPIIQHATFSCHRVQPFEDDKLYALPSPSRAAEKFGARSAIAGGIAVLAGVIMVDASDESVSTGSGALHTFLGGMSLVSAGFAVGATGLAIYFIQRSKRLRAESSE